ncbi:COMM domain-containing protein 7 [Myotis lucifugus]|nr:COMM domain-containing protein 7 [Myotis lucifugus]
MQILRLHPSFSNLTLWGRDPVICLEQAPYPRKMLMQDPGCDPRPSLLRESPRDTGRVVTSPPQARTPEAPAVRTCRIATTATALSGSQPSGPLNTVPPVMTVGGALKKSLTAEQVRADFITLGLSEEKATYFSEKWKQNAPTLARWAIGQTLMINQLIDMEWKFGVTSGSSELEKVGSIFLQLKLVLKKGNQTENLYIELTLPQFYSFLHEMERVRTSMECFS